MRLRFDLVFAALAASIVFLVFAVANAQTAPAGTQAQPSTSGAAGAVPLTASDIVAVPIWPKAIFPLPEQPAATSFSLGQIEGVAPKLLSGVTAKGYARKVAVEDQTIGQVLVMSVAKGDKEETISTEGLTAQFDAKETSQLFPEKTVEVKGSKTALIAALERLNKTEEKEEEKKSSTESNIPSQNSGSKPSNSLAGGYSSPSVSAPAEEADPVIDVRTSMDGCPVRIDYLQEKAVVQSKEQTFTDGALSSETPCSDSEVSYPLKKSLMACPVDIPDLETMQAWPQFQWYYVDDAAANHPVGECQKDTATVYTITEDEGQCPIFLDFLAEQAVPQSAYVYIGRNNAVTQVPGKGCAASTKSAPIPMKENVAACPMRPDYPANLSYELSMWTYVRDGVTYQAAPCADTGRTFQHEIVYADAAGNYICPAITNLTITPKKVTLQSRRRIVVDGVPAWVNDCTPDTTSKDILSTRNTCKDPTKWTHDLNAGISYGQERFYYGRVDGTPEYVTECQNSTITYHHDVNVTGYQYHDDQLWAYPLTTVTIDLGDINALPYTVATSTVLPGAAQWAYVLDGTVDQKTGQTTYEPEPNGCNAYRQTAHFEKWKRPDDSTFLKQVGVGIPEGPVDVCVTNTVKSAQVLLSRYCSFSHSGGDAFTETTTYGDNQHTINKNEIKNIETGTVVATTCDEASISKSQMYSSTYYTGIGGVLGTIGSRDTIMECGGPLLGLPLVPSQYRTVKNTGGTRYAASSANWPGYTAVYGTSCPAGF